ncbi:MAG: hypothetical protein ACK559_07485, partial [bacterium]
MGNRDAAKLRDGHPGLLWSRAKATAPEPAAGRPAALRLSSRHIFRAGRDHRCADRFRHRHLLPQPLIDRDQHGAAVEAEPVLPDRIVMDEARATDRDEAERHQPHILEGQG